MMENGQHILERYGSKIHFWLSGTFGRPLIVFTHGATLDHRSFDIQVELLKRDYRVLT